MSERFVPIRAVGDRVFLGNDSRLNRPVMLKTFSEKEAQACLNFGSWAGMTLLDATSEYLVLEHIPHETLAARLAQGSVNPDWARRILKELVDKFEELEALGFVYTDLKPEHVCVSVDGRVSLCDLEGIEPASPAGCVALNQAFAPICWALADHCPALRGKLRHWASLASRPESLSPQRGMALLSRKPRRPYLTLLAVLVFFPAHAPELPHSEVLSPPPVVMQLRTR